MKTIKYMYDEGYGCGEHEFSYTGWTVNELAKKFIAYSEAGYGDSIVFDAGWEPIENIRLKENFYLDKKSVVIE